MRALIDCDILRYQIGSIALEHPFLKKERVPAPVSEIERITEDTIQHVIKATGADSYVCVLSGKGNFRIELAKQEPYKGNRNASVGRPYHYDTVGDYIKRSHPTVVVDGIEADDWLGIEQRKDIENNIICSRDKDLGTVHGWHYRWACGDKQPERLNHYLSEFEAKEFFFHQMLTGDNTDNIMGCGIRKEVKWGGKLMLRRKGVGSGAADKILGACDTLQEMFDAVKQEYEAVFGDNYEEVMLENARLLYIGQEADNLFQWEWIDYTLKRNCDELFQVTNALSKETLFVNPEKIVTATPMPQYQNVRLTFDDGFGLEIDAKEFVAISNALEVEIYHIDEKIQGVTDDDITDESIDGVNGDDIVVE